MQRSLLLLAALAAVTPLEAQRGRGGGGDVFGYLAGKYDKDKDGKITLAEYGVEREKAKFQGYDRDGDGTITKADFAGGGGRGRTRGGNRGRNTATTSATGPAIAIALATNADADGNSKVTLREWEKVLAALDSNADKIAGPEELNELMCAALGRKKLSIRAIKRRSRHLDVNKDGKVQLGELGAMFAKIDKNKDQLIDATELGAAKPIVRGQPKVGDVAPDFTLPFVKDMKTQVRLSSFKGKKPVALIFGSYT